MHMQYACLQCVFSWNLSANMCMCSVKVVVLHVVAMPCSVSLYMCSYSTNVSMGMWCVCVVWRHNCISVICSKWSIRHTHAVGMSAVYVGFIYFFSERVCMCRIKAVVSAMFCVCVCNTRAIMVQKCVGCMWCVVCRHSIMIQCSSPHGASLGEVGCSTGPP